MRPAGRSGKITVLGEAVVRLAPTSDETTVRALPGGSALNIAIAAVRLGYPAALMARLSGDPFGQLLRRHAARNGVNLSAAPDADEPTTIEVLPDRGERGERARLYLGGAASAPWSAGRPGGHPAGHEGAAHRLAGLVRRAEREPGAENGRAAAAAGDAGVHRPQRASGGDGLAGRGRILLDRAIRAADVIRASTQDVAWLLRAARRRRWRSSGWHSGRAWW